MGASVPRRNQALWGAAAVFSVLMGFPALACAVPLDGLQPVGLEARGVDPLAAVLCAKTLDVRDALNRPVSSLLIERQMKAAMTSSVEQVSFFTRLPHLQAVLKSLERLIYQALSLTGSAPWLPVCVVQAIAPGPRVLHRALSAHAFASAVPRSCKFLSCSGRGVPFYPDNAIPLVLRC